MKAVYHGTQVPEALLAGLEMIDGVHTDEVYFYAKAEDVISLRVGLTNIFGVNGKQVNLFIGGIEMRYSTALNDRVAYPHDPNLFCGMTPQEARKFFGLDTCREFVLVSAEIMNRD